jgi:hypothetical protein
VRDVHDREPEPLLELADLLAHLAPQPRVEVRQRLVEQQDRGLEHERARDRDPLLLAARELGRQAVVVAFESDGGERLASPAVGVDGLAARHDEPVPDVLEHRHVREQRVALEHHRHVALGRADVGHVAPADQDASRRRQLETGDKAQHRRLAAARGPQQRDQRRRRDVDADVVHGDDVAVALDDVPKRDRGRLHAALPSVATPGRRRGARAPEAALADQRLDQRDRGRSSARSARCSRRARRRSRR